MAESINKNELKEYLKKNLSISIEDELWNSRRTIRVNLELEGEEISADTFDVWSKG